MRINIKPVQGMRIKDPITKIPLKAEGETKPKTTYWNRRLNDGDVVEVKATKSVTNKKEEKSK